MRIGLEVAASRLIEDCCAFRLSTGNFSIRSISHSHVVDDLGFQRWHGSYTGRRTYVSLCIKMWNRMLTSIVLLTSELYWCMMEITLGLLAACIPTLRGLFRSQSADSIVKGIRSLFSTGQGSTSSTELVSSKRSKSLDRDEADTYVTVKVHSKALSQDQPYSSNV